MCARLELSSIAPLELDLPLAARRALASSNAQSPQRLTLNAAISITTSLVVRCACIFEPFPELSSIAQWNVTCWNFGLQGGGLYLERTATLTNTNVYSNQGPRVRSLSALA